MHEYKKYGVNSDDEKGNIRSPAAKIIDEENKTAAYQNRLIYYDSMDAAWQNSDFRNLGEQLSDKMILQICISEKRKWQTGHIFI